MGGGGGGGGGGSSEDIKQKQTEQKDFGVCWKFLLYNKTWLLPLPAVVSDFDWLHCLCPVVYHSTPLQ